jgi:3-keto-disaccharide hydrolase
MRPRPNLPVRITASLLSVAALAACATTGSGSSDSAAGASPAPATTSSASGTSAANTLTPAEQAAGWRLLFDGASTTGWRGYKTQTMPNGWRVEAGTLTKSGSVDDIVTADQFANFELALDWKIATGGNAGIFYRGTEEYEKIYWSAPEYQLLDDANAPDGKNRLTSAAAAYALYPPPAGIVKPAGEWNSTRLVVNGAHVEHWLNGQKVVQYELWSPDWEAKVKASKFNEWPKYGRGKSGHIAIQGDHEGVLALRNIKIRTAP